jgi:hypothetical protein
LRAIVADKPSTYRAFARSARRLFERALTITESVLGRAHTNTNRLQRNLALC